MFFSAVHFFIIYSQIVVTMTLLIVSDIHNHSTKMWKEVLQSESVSGVWVYGQATTVSASVGIDPLRGHDGTVRWHRYFHSIDRSPTSVNDVTTPAKKAADNCIRYSRQALDSAARSHDWLKVHSVKCQRSRSRTNRSDIFTGQFPHAYGYSASQ